LGNRALSLRLSLLLLALLAIPAAWWPNPPLARAQASGDLLVVDRSAGTGAMGALFSVNPSTGARIRISDFGNAVQGPTGVDPSGLIVEATGSILVIDMAAGTGGLGALFRVDPATGSRSILSDFGNAAQGTIGSSPRKVALESSGNLLVVDAGARKLFRVDPSAGSRTVVSDFANGAQGPTATTPISLRIEASGNVLIVDRDGGTRDTRCSIKASGLGCGQLMRVDIGSGTRTVLSDFGNTAQGSAGVNPTGLEIDAAGNVLVVDPNAGTASYSACASTGCGALFSVNTATGARTIVSDFGNTGQGPNGVIPLDMAIDGSGNILVVDEGAGTLFSGALFRVVPSTGTRTIVSDFGNAVQGPTGLDPTGVRLVGETRAGSNIPVGFPQFSPSGLRLTYNSVTTRGVTSVTSAAASNCQKGIVSVQVGTCLQFAFTGAFTGTALITLPYNPASIPSGRSESEVRLFHIKADNTVEDVTTSVDTTNKRVTGATTTFQFFVAGLTSNMDFTLSNSGSITVTQGASGGNTITATLISGTPSSVTLSCSGLPSGASCSFSPASGSPTFTSTLTITTSSSTPTGSSTITVSGTGGGVTRTTTFTLTVNPSPSGSDFSLSASGGIILAPGGSGTNTITVTLTLGTPGTVSLTCSNLPAGASCSFSPASGTPTFTSTLTVSTSATTPTGTFSVVVTGTSAAGVTRTTQFTLQVGPPAIPGNPAESIVAGLIFGVIAMLGFRLFGRKAN